MEICIVRFSSKYFSASNKECNIVADISTLERIHNPIADRLYDDACDEGFIIVSERTGREATFYLDQKIYGADLDAEVNSWLFRPTPETIRRNPQLREWTVEIFND